MEVSSGLGKPVAESLLIEKEVPDLSKKWDESDVTLMVEGKQIYASRVILSIWSPVFKAMFKGDFKEGDSEDIPLPEKKYSDVLCLLKICHVPGIQIPGEKITALLPLAREYQMKTVIELCEKHLLTKPASIRNLLLAEEYSLPALRASCMRFAKQTPVTNLKRQLGFAQMFTGTSAEILLDKLERYEPIIEAVKEIKVETMLKRKCNTCKKEECVQCGYKAEPVAKVYREEYDYDLQYRKVLKKKVDMYLCQTCTGRRFQSIHDKLMALNIN